MKRYNLTKKNLQKKIYYNLGIPNILSDKILNSFFKLIYKGLLRDGEVKISNLGKFKLLDKRARTGRNPKTKQEYIIKQRKSVSFYPSLKVKKRLND